jgi:DNA polymerase-3 subunit beta
MASQAETMDEPDQVPPKRRGRPPKAKPEGIREGAAAAAPAEDPRRRAVRIRAGTLKAALKDVTGFVAGRSEIPILSHLLLQAGDGRIELTATDIDAWAVRDCASERPDAGERGFTVTLPAKPLEAILGELDPDATVTLSLDTEAIDAELREAWKGQVAIAAGRSRFRLHCLPPADFPLPKPFSVHAAFELTCAALEGDFARVEHAISTEETRYYLNGVFVHTAQEEGAPLELCMAATDGHRLARLRLDPPDGAASFPHTIIPRRTVDLLDKLLREAAKKDADKDGSPAVVLVEIDGDGPGATLRFSLPAADGGEITVTAKSIDGTFPDYSRVIPSGPPHSAICARAPLAEAVKRVGVLASDRTRCVKAVFGDDRLELVVTTPELGEAREEVPCSYEGPEVSIGFNGQYWREALAALACDDVSMAFDAAEGGSNLSPVLLRAAGEGVDRDALVQVLMPMRV